MAFKVLNDRKKIFSRFKVMNEAHKLFKVGLIGTGRISDIYLQNCSKFDGISVDVCGSLNLQESAEKAQKFGVRRVAHPDAI